MESRSTAENATGEVRGRAPPRNKGKLNSGVGRGRKKTGASITERGSGEVVGIFQSRGGGQVRGRKLVPFNTGRGGRCRERLLAGDHVGHLTVTHGLTLMFIPFIWKPGRP